MMPRSPFIAEDLKIFQPFKLRAGGPKELFSYFPAKLKSNLLNGQNKSESMKNKNLKKQ